MRGPVLLVLLAGCGGIAFEDYPDAVRDATCDYLVRCHAASNLDDCRASYDRTAIETPSLSAAIDADKVSYDEDAAQRCIDAYGALSCDETLLPDDALAECDDVLTGRLHKGEVCAFDAECVSDHCTSSSCSDACCSGTCADPIVYPGIGDPCTSLCEDGAYCGADSTCHALLPVGASCDMVSLCGRALYCAGLSGTGSGVCTPLPHEAEACEGSCAELGTICNGTCVAAGLAGDPCELAYDCSELYTCTGGVCGDYPSLGMACTTECSGASFCDDGTCVEQQANGADCLYGEACKTHYCGDAGVCADVPLCI
jgi:hypothetical protein